MNHNKLRLFSASLVRSNTPVRHKETAPRKDRSGVYVISGVKGQYVGIPAVRDRLYELGVQMSVAALQRRVNTYDGKVGKYTVKRVGDATRSSKGQIKEINLRGSGNHG